jgi:hypothetical protein
MRPHEDELTPAEMDELGALLVAERPRPAARFAAELDARVERRFADPAPRRAARRWLRLPSGPAAPAFAATLAAVLVALVVVLDTTGGPRQELPSSGGSGAPVLTDGAAEPAPATADDAVRDQAESGGGGGRSLGPNFATVSPPGSGGRKVEQSASIELGTAPDRLDAVAQGVLGIVARFDGIVDRSAVQGTERGGDASFLLRVPSDKLQPALAALSRIPNADVLARSDETVDVNQAYVSIRRQLANARAERQGLLRALAAADTEDETLRLRFRLDAVERTIARAERSQRALDRRIDYSRISVSIRAEQGGEDDGAGTFTPGRALDDAGRVLAVALGVAIIAAAALLPFAVLAAIAWPLARALTRRRREQALDAA